MREALLQLREEMKREAVDAVLIPSGDFHGSEYAGAYFQSRAYVSGFTGSAGTLLVLQDWAGLWTDGRYFLQAEEQLAGSGIELMKEGLPNTPSFARVLSDRLQTGTCLAFDGRCVSARTGRLLQKQLASLEIVWKTDLDLVGRIRKDRPPLSTQPVWRMPLAEAGESTQNKLLRLREKLQAQHIDRLLVASLEEIAWLLNLRGDDIAHTPVFLSYLMLTERSCVLYANPQIFAPEHLAYLQENNITLKPYEAVYEDTAQIPPPSVLSMDMKTVNFRLQQSVPSGVRVFDRPAPLAIMKACKNPIEQAGMRLAHQKDGIALTKFIYQMKTAQHLPTEWEAGLLLQQLRAEQAGYLQESFAPIVAYGAHGAVVHYSASPEDSAPIERGGFLLVDTGGHYAEGTTDCTRTLALGQVTQEMKCHYTAVLRGQLALQHAQFLQGVTGANLDVLARSPLWALGLDFNHGTGHGVGHVLSVHESPNRIHWKHSPESLPFATGMVCSNEPAFYQTGSYGIRLENLMLCTERAKSEYGIFLGFEALTLVPFDPDALDLAQMRPEEVAWLNAYHAEVFAQIAPHLQEAERSWLADVTAPLVL